MIAEGRIDDLQDFVARGDSRTTKSLATSMIDLIRAGRIDESTALENSDRPQELLRILRGVHSSSEQVRR